ncbi:hypothetical protein HYFRA_00007352 [Hymenoscyphus fraxineus]|uniref:Uncharacterized protein n=1 Tax=Hymenoscyphus fraxineus TaxID=746836 RepID=A0A9N9KQT7_9HELO|nr:hypothetical protein HYFRA_00007352 [Hymenoscyphus fraxineus]
MASSSSATNSLAKNASSEDATNRPNPVSSMSKPAAQTTQAKNIHTPLVQFVKAYGGDAALSNLAQDLPLLQPIDWEKLLHAPSKSDSHDPKDESMVGDTSKSTPQPTYVDEIPSDLNMTFEEFVEKLESGSPEIKEVLGAIETSIMRRLETILESTCESDLDTYDPPEHTLPQNLTKEQKLEFLSKKFFHVALRGMAYIFKVKTNMLRQVARIAPDFSTYLVEQAPVLSSWYTDYHVKNFLRQSIILEIMLRTKYDSHLTPFNMCVYDHFHDGLSEDINAIVYALRLWAVENYDPTGIHSRPKPTVSENKNLSPKELRPGAPNKKAWSRMRAILNRCPQHPFQNNETETNNLKWAAGIPFAIGKGLSSSIDHVAEFHDAHGYVKFRHEASLLQLQFERVMEDSNGNTEEDTTWAQHMTAQKERVGVAIDLVVLSLDTQIHEFQEHVERWGHEYDEDALMDSELSLKERILKPILCGHHPWEIWRNKFRESWWRKMQSMGLQWTTKFDIQDRVVIWRGKLDDKSKNGTGRGVHDYIAIGGPTFAEQTIELIKTEIWTRDIEKAMSGLKLMSMKDWQELDRIDDDMQEKWEQAEKRKNKNKNKNKRRKENKKNKKAAESSAVPKNGEDDASETPKEGHETTGTQEPKAEGFHTDDAVVNENIAEPENLIKTGDGDKALEATAALLTTDNKAVALSEEEAELEIAGWLDDIAILGNYQIPGIIESQKQAIPEEEAGLEIGGWLDDIATLGNYQIPGIIQPQKHHQDQQPEFTPQVTDREEEAQNKQQQAEPEAPAMAALFRQLDGERLRADEATQEASALRQKLEEVEAKLAQAKSREATLTNERNEAEREAERAIHAFLEANEKAEQQQQKHGEGPEEFPLWAKEVLPWPPIAEAPPEPATQPHTLAQVEEELTKERKRREEVEAELDLGYRHKLQGFEFVKKLNLEYHEQKEGREEAEEKLASLREEAMITKEVWKHVAELREMFSNEQIGEVVKGVLEAAKKSEMYRLGIKADLPEEVLEGIRGESEGWLEEEMGRVGERVVSAVRVWVREEIKLAVFGIQMRVKERIEEEVEKDVVEKRGPQMAWRGN